MNIDKLVNEFIIYKTRNTLTIDEYEEVVNDILWTHGLLPIKDQYLTKEEIYTMKDMDMVQLLSDGYFFHAVKFFMKRGKNPPSTSYYYIY